LERATGFEPATLGLGNLSRNSDFSGLVCLAYQTASNWCNLGALSAPQLHPAASDDVNESKARLSSLI